MTSLADFSNLNKKNEMIDGWMVLRWLVGMASHFV